MNSQQNSVNFYILPDSNADNRYFFVFRLVEKAYEKGLPVLILTVDAQQSAAIDRLLWAAKPARFIPHQVVDSKAAVASRLSPILITHERQILENMAFDPQVVIDISYDGTPLNYPKVMLVANQHAEILNNARMKYQGYINQGIKPQVYKIREEQLALT